MKLLKKLLLAVLLLLVLIQLWPVDRSNPPVTSEVPAPADVAAILRRSCYDCHSNETRWPWYAYVAPVSWLVAHDVEEGREHLNFSAWAEIRPEKLPGVMEEIWEEVSEGAMPLSKYLRLHDDARLSETDLARLQAWCATP